MYTDQKFHIMNPWIEKSVGKVALAEEVGRCGGRTRRSVDHGRDVAAAEALVERVEVREEVAPGCR